MPCAHCQGGLHSLIFLYEKTNAYYSKMQISQSLGISLMIVDSFSLPLSFKGELDKAVKLNINKLLMQRMLRHLEKCIVM